MLHVSCCTFVLLLIERKGAKPPNLVDPLFLNPEGPKIEEIQDRPWGIEIFKRD